MSEENNKDSDKMHRYTQGRDSLADHLLEATEAMLANTRAFLDRIEENEESTRRYVEGLKNSLESDQRRLERDRREVEEKDENG